MNQASDESSKGIAPSYRPRVMSLPCPITYNLANL
jgi:hypothetical protein